MKKFNEDVYYSSSCNARDIEFLKKEAANSERQCCRICTHNDPNDTLHEMFIVLMNGRYVPPHSHKKSSESSFIIEGEGVMNYFDDKGNITESIYLNSDSKLGTNYIRTPIDKVHSLFIYSPCIVFKETILGPFDRKNMFEPKWAPKEQEREKVEQFLIESEIMFHRVKGEMYGS